MNPTLAQAYTDAVALFADVIAGSPDTCSIYNVTTSNDGSGGATQSDGTAVASNIKCLYGPKNYSTTQIVGGDMSHVTHEICMMETPTIRGIKPNYVFVVAARGDRPALRFEKPVLMDAAMESVARFGVQLKKA